MAGGTEGKSRTKGGFPCNVAGTYFLDHCANHHMVDGVYAWERERERVSVCKIVISMCVCACVRVCVCAHMRVCVYACVCVPEPVGTPVLFTMP